MSNILDYIKWRGDVSFEYSEFNEVDNVILERFSYFPLESVIEKNEEVTIKQVSDRFGILDFTELNFIWEADKDLVPLIGGNERYSKLKVSDFEYKFDKESEEQFAAVIIHLNEDVMYLSYRGTDSSVVGWKEDFNLAFKSHVGAQKSALDYLNRMAQKYPNKKMILAGHSKGGNIAIYSAVYTTKEIKDRIINVFNNDGPGFEQSIIDLPEYKEISNKIITYLPQSSIIGMAMNHAEEIVIVKSNEKGIMQHDVYSWEVERNSLIRKNKLTNDSIYIDKTVSKWLESVEVEKRKQVVDIIFDLIYKTEIESFKEFGENKVKYISSIIKSYNDLDKDSKKIIVETIGLILKLARENMNELLK